MHVLILTEGSLEWGLGHLYRCQGFARFFVNKGIPVKWMVNGDARAGQFLQSQAAGSGVIVDWTDADALGADLDGCLCAIVDSYHAPEECYERISKKVHHCIWVDDEARLTYPGGTVVNPNPLVVQREDDSGQARATVLSGFEYQLLREEFANAPRRECRQDVRRALVMMGGTDLRQLTPRVVGLLQATLPDMTLDVIVPSTEQRAAWAHLASRACTLHGLKSASEIRELMQLADFAVTAAGQTLCEAASQGLPTLAIGVAENQRIHADALQSMGATRFVGWHDDPDLMNLLGADLLRICDENLRRDMGSAGQAKFDGNGVQRIACSVMDWCEQQVMRQAVLSDSEQVWKISNQPSVREHSINKGAIPWAEHEEWFSRAVANPELLFFVVEYEERIIGQLRYRRSADKHCVVSISLSHDARGSGSAARLLKEGDVRCFCTWPDIEAIDAEISMQNIASMKTFTKAGYAPQSDTHIYGEQVFSLLRKERHCE